MRLRLTIKRHGLPDTSILWPVADSPSPTIAELLELVNESIPIEAEEWGFEDYAVELKGYECLHYQRCSAVFRDDDEVVIRPLLTQDIKTRKRSGRHQISVDGYKLYDGLAYGKTLTRALASRPSVKIPPRKKRRVTYHTPDEIEDEDELDEGHIQAIEAGGEDESSEDNSKQLVLHADFENDDDYDSQDDDDDDDEDDDDFVPGQGSDGEEDGMVSEDAAQQSEDEHHGSTSEAQDSGIFTKKGLDQLEGDNSLTAEDKKTLQNITSEATRSKVRKLHSAFPSSSIAVCNFVLIGTGEDLSEAYEAMTRGFVAVQPKSALAEADAGFAKESSSQEPKGKKRASSALTERSLEASSPDETENQPGAKKRIEAVIGISILKGNGGDLVIPKTRSKRAKNYSVDSEIDEPREDQRLEDLNDEDDSSEEEDDIDERAKYYDQNGFPSGSIQRGKLITFESESMQRGSSSPSPLQRSDMVEIIEDGNSKNEHLSSPPPSIPTDEERLDDESSDTSDSSSDESSDSSDDDDNGKRPAERHDSDSASSSEDSEGQSTSESSSSSSRDSSSDSSSEDDGPEERSSKFIFQAEGGRSSLLSGLPTPTSVSRTASLTAPHRGTPRTKSRNQRRKDGRVLQQMKERGILPQEATIVDLRQLSDVNLATDPVAGIAAFRELKTVQSSAPSTSKDAVSAPTSQSQEFETRRNELLAALAAGGVEVGGTIAQVNSRPSQKGAKASHTDSDTDKADTGSPRFAQVKNSPLGPLPSASELQDQTFSHPNVQQPSLTLPAENLEVSTSTTEERPATAAGTPAARSSPAVSSQSVEARPARRKLDLGAGRRMLFGHLGVKAPKTKEDEDKIRKDLMKNIRPVHMPRGNEADAPTNLEAHDPAPQDPEAWREKINYRAVECVQEGIVLSEPPFPFVQRWDPQQQLRDKRKNYQVDQEYYDDSQQSSKKQKKRKKRNSYAEQEKFLEDSYQPSYPDILKYDDESSQLPTSVDEASQQLLDDMPEPTAEESQDPEDLAPLPEDPTALPVLEAAGVRPGMTIAFKTLEMNAATRWQPQLSDYQTAIVLSIQHGEIQLSLAKRDRVQHLYDEETGERIYEKFEMPMDDEAEDDNGLLFKTFEELKEPRIVQDTPIDYNGDATSATHPGNEDYGSRDDSVALDKSNEVQTPSDTSQQCNEAQDTLVPETQLNTSLAFSEEQNESETPHRSTDISDLPRVAHQHEPQETLDSAQLEQSDLLMHHASNNTNTDSLSTNIPAPEAIVADIRDFPSSIPHETRQAISDMIEEAGFRSSIASSITKINLERSNDIPGGDAAVFEKLLNDKAAGNNTQSSLPVTSGEVGAAFTQSRASTGGTQPRHGQSSWATYDGTSSPPVHAHEAAELEQESQVWETDSEGQLSSPVVERTSLKTADPAPPRQRVAVGKAQAIWEQLAGLKSKSHSAPSPEDPTFVTEVTLPETSNVHTSATVTYPKLSAESSFTSIITDNGRQPDFESEDSTTDNNQRARKIRQPSFLVSGDHDPDINLPQSVLHSDGGDSRRTPLAQAVNRVTDGLSQNSSRSQTSRLPSKSPISARIAALLMSPVKAVISKQPGLLQSHIQPDPSPLKDASREVTPSEPHDADRVDSENVRASSESGSALQNSFEHRETEPVVEDQDLQQQYSDSDDEFPDLDVILSQRSIKSEEAAVMPMSKIRETNSVQKISKVGLVNSVKNSEALPIASHSPFTVAGKQKVAQRRSTRERRSVSRSSNIEPLREEPRPMKEGWGSQKENFFIDLTQASDAEDNIASAPSASQLAAALVESDDEQPNTFATVNLDSEEDWDADKQVWVKKEKPKKKPRSNSATTGGRGKSRAASFRSSSQRSVSSRGRKTSSHR